MKRLAILATIIAFVGCSQFTEDLDITPDAPQTDAPTLYASVPEFDSRAFVEGDRYVRWNAKDKISVFADDRLHYEYAFQGSDGDSNGLFTKQSYTEVGSGGFIISFQQYFAIYPYNHNTNLTSTNPISFNITLPATQNYSVNSFASGVNTMMAVTQANTADNHLKFKNVCGYIKLNLYNDTETTTIERITIKGRNSEKIAGSATVSMEYGDESPTIAMATDSNATDTITIYCGENSGVTLSNDPNAPTAIWVVVPPIKFSNGITIEVTDVNNFTFTKSTKSDKSFTIESSCIQPLATLKVACEPENNKIYYRRVGNSEITPNTDATSPFGDGVTIASNVVDEYGRGVITLSKDITTIGEKAFMNCTNLTSIALPNSVTSIGKYAFEGCTSLATVDFPSAIQSIGQEAFYECTALCNVDFPNSITSMGKHAFAFCKAFTRVAIPESLKIVPECGFLGCENLEYVTIPGTVTDIDMSAFTYCKKIHTLYINDLRAWCNTNIHGLAAHPFGATDAAYITEEEAISKKIYLNGSLVTSIPSDSNITAVKNFAFYNYRHLTSADLSDATTIGDYAFYQCTNLKGDLNLSKVDGYIGERAFFKCPKITSVKFGDNVKVIDSAAFYECTALSKITDMNQVTHIYSTAFGDTALTEVTLPSTLKHLGGWVFNCCTQLHSVYCKAKTPPTIPDNEYNTFLQNRMDRIIYVPKGTLSAYKAANGWKTYASDVEGYAPEYGGDMVESDSF